MTLLTTSMFNIGFGELTLVLITAIYAVKPQHLPIIIKAIAKKASRARHDLACFKAELEELKTIEPPTNKIDG